MDKKLLKIGISCEDNIDCTAYKQIILTFNRNQLFEFCIPILYTRVTNLLSYYKKMKISSVRIININCASESEKGYLNIMNTNDKSKYIECGQLIVKSNITIDNFIHNGIFDLKEKKIDILIILQISIFQKITLELANYRKSLPIIVNGFFKIVEVFEPISVEILIEKIKILHLILVNDFIITYPRIAIISVKLFTKIIFDAIRIAFQKVVFCFGIFDFETFFNSGAYKNFDAAIIVGCPSIDFKSISNETNIIFIGNSLYVIVITDFNMLLSAIYLSIDIYRSRELRFC